MAASKIHLLDAIIHIKVLDNKAWMTLINGKSYRITVRTAYHLLSKMGE